MNTHKFIAEERKDNRILLPGDPGFEDILKGAKNYKANDESMPEGMDPDFNPKEWEYSENIVPRIDNPTEDIGEFIRVKGMSTRHGKPIGINPLGRKTGYDDKGWLEQQRHAATEGIAVATPKIFLTFLQQFIRAKNDQEDMFYLSGVKVSKKIIDEIYVALLDHNDNRETLIGLDFRVRKGSSSLANMNSRGNASPEVSVPSKLTATGYYLIDSADEWGIPREPTNCSKYEPGKGFTSWSPYPYNSTIIDENCYAAFRTNVASAGIDFSVPDKRAVNGGIMPIAEYLDD